MNERKNGQSRKIDGIVVIRQACLADEGQIARLFSDENAHHHVLQPSVFNRLHEHEILPKNWLIGIMDDTSRFLDVAELENTLVGLVLFTVNKNDDLLYKQKIYIDIDEITVLSAYRNQGIGKRLLDKVKEHSRDIGAESIRLEVWGNNDASILFYEKNGFEVKKHVMWLKK